MEKLLGAIQELKTKYEGLRDNDRFNLISIFYKEREEKLHSRVISYLLSPESGHGMNETYCRLFVRHILKLDETKFDLSDFKVLPNEKDKSEYKYIDILIINKSKSQAIIIENKIDAKDSNHNYKRLKNNSPSNFKAQQPGETFAFANEGYIGQLERYYNTIFTGIDKDGVSCIETKCNDIYVFYLSPEGKHPDIESIGILDNHPKSWNENSIISYDSSIREWLKECINNTPDERNSVKEFIQHYLKIVNKMTHNDIPTEERILLKNIIAENIKDSKYLFDNFKHVKWHAIHEFWLELSLKLHEVGYSNIKFYVNEENLTELHDKQFIKAITEVSHHGNNSLNYGILFDLKNNSRGYVSGQNVLSWGIVHSKWANFNDQRISAISLSDFSNDTTFNLISLEMLKMAVSIIIEEIFFSEKLNFENMLSI